MNATFIQTCIKKPSVSLHAVTRFCQRVLDVTELPAGGSRSPLEQAERHCAAVNLTVVQVQAMILTPKVCLEFAMGRPQSHNELFCAIFKHGVIATVYSVDQAERTFIDQRARCKKLRPRSDNEMRRLVHRLGRRAR
jgi:hypothetical protein